MPEEQPEDFDATTIRREVTQVSKQTIIDWQRDSLLVATGQSRGNKLLLEKVSHQLVGENQDGLTITPEQALHRAVGQLSLGKSDVTVIASREIVEVRTLSIPRIDADELPDVIRFQAQRQLANMGDTWALDYVLLPDEPGQEMQTALVGVISPAHMAEIETACSGAGLQLAHVSLRPIEIARFALSTGKLPTSGATMVVCMSQQHADLTILKEGKVVQIRCTRLPSEPEKLPVSIRGEIRRSLLAASSQIGSQAISHVLLLAAADLAEQAEGAVAEATGTSVAVIDPASLLPAKFQQREQLSHSSANRIAALAGAASSVAADRRISLDFKNPKKRPPKKKNTTQWLLAAAATALLVLGGVSWWVTTNRSLDQDLAFYRTEIENKKELVEVAQQRVDELQQIEKFLEDSPNFLDELTFVAQRIPAADKVIMRGLTLNILADGSGQIVVPVEADSSSTIDDFEDSLRDEHHVVKGSNNSQSNQPSEHYAWQAVEKITISGLGWKLLDDNDSPKSAQQPKTAQQPSSESESEEAPQPQTDATEEPAEDEDNPPAPAEGETDDQVVELNEQELLRADSPTNSSDAS